MTLWRLLTFGLAAAALSGLSTALGEDVAEARPPGSPAPPSLDRARLLQLLGETPASPPPLAAERLERVDLGDVVREKVTYAVEPGGARAGLGLHPEEGTRTARGRPLPSPGGQIRLGRAPRPRLPRPHQFSPALREAAYAWLDRWLARPAN